MNFGPACFTENLTDHSNLKYYILFHQYMSTDSISGTVLPSGDMIMNKMDMLPYLTELTTINLMLFVLKRKNNSFCMANHYPPPSTNYPQVLKNIPGHNISETNLWRRN